MPVSASVEIYFGCSYSPGTPPSGAIAAPHPPRKYGSRGVFGVRLQIRLMSHTRTAAVLVLALAAAFLLFRRGGQKPELDARSVVTQVRQLNQLATVRYTVQKVVGLREQKDPVGSESILLVMQARVEGGIDLSGIKEEDVFRRPDGALVVRLPPARVLNVAVDENETKVWDRTKTWWTPWVPYSRDLEQRARVAGLESVKQSALDMGILKHAERNAESSIRGLLGLAGIQNVVILPAGMS